jgi:hypothetical protein
MLLDYLARPHIANKTNETQHAGTFTDDSQYLGLCRRCELLLLQ